MAVVEIPQTQSLSVPLHVVPVSQQGTSSSSLPKRSTHHLDQTLLSNGVASAPKQDDRLATGDLSFHEPAARMGSLTTLVEPELQYPQARSPSVPSPSDIMIVTKDDQSPRSTPLSSTSPSNGFPTSSSSNQPSTFVPYSRPSHLSEGSMVMYPFCL